MAADAAVGLAGSGVTAVAADAAVGVAGGGVTVVGADAPADGCGCLFPFTPLRTSTPGGGALNKTSPVTGSIGGSGRPCGDAAAFADAPVALTSVTDAPVADAPVALTPDPDQRLTGGSASGSGTVPADEAAAVDGKVASADDDDAAARRCTFNQMSRSTFVIIGSWSTTLAISGGKGLRISTHRLTNTRRTAVNGCLPSG